MRILFEGVFPVHYGQFYLLPRDVPALEPAAAFRGQANGLCGAARGDALFLVTGLHTGQVPVRVVRCDAAPDDDTSVWEDVVEVSLQVDAAVALEAWGGGERQPLALEPGTYRVRYRCVGMDEGQAMDTPEDGQHAPDRYELAVWPDATAPDLIVKTGSDSAAYWHRAWGQGGA